MPPLSAESTHSSSGTSVESVEQPWLAGSQGLFGRKSRREFSWPKVYHESSF